MPPLYNQFWQELELFQRNLQRTLRLGADIMGQFNRMFPPRPQGEVIDLGRRVQVAIPLPDLARNSLCACRVLDGTLYVAGFMQREQTVKNSDGMFFAGNHRRHFFRSVPLPVAVRRRPAQHRYENGVLTLVFDKHDGPPDQRWYEFKI